MSRNRIGRIAAVALLALMFGLAFVIAPTNCEDGLVIYFWCGVVALAALAALPFVAGFGSTWPWRTAIAAGLVLAGAATWLAGLFAGHVKIICKLF